MSEKIQEFLEVPQEFVREGNQVRYPIFGHSHHIPHKPPQFLVRCTKPSRKGLHTMLIVIPEHLLMRQFDA